MDAIFQLLLKNKDMANAIAAVASALVALIALFVSLYALHIQRRHNILSIRPIPEVTVADFENSLRVKLRNNGPGPMTIVSFKVFKGNEVKDSVIEWMPTLPPNRPWNHFAMALEQSTIQSNGVVPLVELTAGEDETNFPNWRDLTRAELSKLRVVVYYTDIYESNLSPYEKSLIWFRRNLNDT